MKRYSFIPMLRGHIDEACADIEAQYRDGIAEEGHVVVQTPADILIPVVLILKEA